MKDLTEKEFQRRLQKIQKRNRQVNYRKRLREERLKNLPKFKIETSKILAIYLFALLNGIIIYSMIVMWTFVDFSYLGVLISDIAAQVLIYAIYCMKAYKAKKSEEEIKYMREHFSGTLDNILESGANSDEYVPLNGDVETFSSSDCDSVG